jgi:PKD repeat protein
VTHGDAPLAVLFTDIPTGSPTAWSWDFGDSGTATTENSVHLYVGPGTYTVSLTATNADGSDTMTRLNYITVTSPTPAPTPVPTITPTPTPTPPAPIVAGIKIVPETLNLRSKGVFTAFFTLPPGYDLNAVDALSIVCEGAHATSGKVAGKTYMAKFERTDISGISPGDDVVFTVTGTVRSGTQLVPFSGSDMIRVIS